MNYQYRVGGSLAYNHPTYVERKADRELLQSLKAGKFCYVFNCRQMGKSSLRVRTMHQLQAEGMYCASVDITSLGSNDNLQQWYNGLITQLFLGFNLAGKINLKTWLREREDLPPPQKLSQFIEEILLVQFPEQKIFIFIDEIDKVISFQFSLDDFFSLIRYFYNQKAENFNYERITFALFGVATPSDLIREKTQTSFNIGHAIELTGFVLDEVQPLEEGLTETSENPQALLQEILNWTRGQPFLTQKVCQLILDDKTWISKDNEIDIVKKIIDSQVIENWESQDEPVHLKTIRDRLLRNEQKASRLLGLYQHILNQGFIEADDSAEQTELRLSGLVVKRNGKLTIYNQIYQAVFNKKWIEKQLEKLRPYSETIQAWEASKFQDESRLLRGQALKDALLWAANKSLSNLDYQFLTASQNLDKREAELSLEAEKKANKILSDANYKATQRIRIGAAILSVGSTILIISLVGAFISQKQAWDAQKGIKLQKIGDYALQQFQFEQLEALTSAMQAGQELQTIVKDGRKLQNYPTTSPILTLQQILDHIQEKNQLEGHQETIYSVSYKGNYIATASADGTVKLWNQQGKEILPLKGHQGSVYSVSFSPDGQRLATASQDKTIKLWNLQGQELKTFRGHEKSVFSVSFSPDGQEIASTSRDGTARLWNLQGKQLAILQGHSDSVDDISFSKDGKQLATASRDGSVRIWDKKGNLLKILGQEEKTFYYSVSFSPDGKYIAAAAKKGIVKIWDTQGNLIAILQGHPVKDLVNSISFSPDGKWLVTASSDGTAKLWNYLQKEELATFKGHQQAIIDVVFSPDSQRIVTASSDATAKIWDISNILTDVGDKTGKTWDAEAANSLQQGIINVSFAPDGSKITIVDKDNKIYLCDFQGNLITAFSSDVDRVNSINFSPDGNQIVVAAKGGVVKLWNLQGELITQFEADNVSLYSVVFSLDGQYLATGSITGNVKIWNLQSNKPQLVQQFQAYEQQISSIVFSENGQELIVTSSEGKMGLWDKKGNLKTSFAGHQDIIYQVRFSPDGQQIATVSNDRTAKLWDLQGNLLATLNQGFYPVYSINYSPDSEQIVTADGNGTASLWDSQGNLRSEFKGYQNSIYGVAFRNNGQEVVTVSREGKVRVWQVEEELTQLENLLEQGCDWLKDYLNTHPEERQQLTVCHPSDG